MRKLEFCAVAIAVILGPAVAFGQGTRTKPTTATYITKEEVDVVNRQGQGIDRNLKVVDIGHENFTVGIIHRGKTVNGVAVPAPGAAANAATAARGAAAPPAEPCGRQMATAPAGGSAGGITHDSQTEGYYIVSGGGTMFTDGYIVNGRHSPSRNLNGPTCGGMAYDVMKKVVKAWRHHHRSGWRRARLVRYLGSRGVLELPAVAGHSHRGLGASGADRKSVV